MVNYTATLILTDAQDIALKNIAAKAGKTVQVIIDQLAKENIMGQIQQWISDKVKEKLAVMDAADALVKLNA